MGSDKKKRSHNKKKSAPALEGVKERARVKRDKSVKVLADPDRLGEITVEEDRGNGADIVEAPNEVNHRLPVKIAAHERERHEEALLVAIHKRRDLGAQWKLTIDALKGKCKDLDEQIEREADADGHRAGQKIAGLVDQLRSAEMALGEANAQRKAALAEVQASMDRLAMVINSGVEYREVACRIERDHKTKSVRTIRTDTDALISDRVMEEVELQQELPT